MIRCIRNFKDNAWFFYWSCKGFQLIVAESPYKQMPYISIPSFNLTRFCAI
jgi:hypothetical protein